MKNIKTVEKVKNAGAKFRPTENDKEMVSLMKACNIKDDIIRRSIINPETKEPISPTTFLKEFENELKNCKGKINKKCVNILFDGLDATKDVFDSEGKIVGSKPDYDVRLKCVNQVRQLASKGVYEDKFEMPENLSLSEQLEYISLALRQNKITNYYADSFTNIIKAKIESEKEIDRTTGITVNVDGKTIGQLAGVVKDLIK